MLTTPKLLVLTAILAATQSTILWIDRNLTPAPAVLPAKDLNALPLELGMWTGKDAPLDDTLARSSGAAVMINRHYRNPSGDFVLCNCGIWIDYDTVLPHSPESCYPAAGWELVEKKDVAIELPGRASIPARLDVFERNSERIAIVFWCRLGSEVVLDHAPVRAARQRLRGTGQRLSPAIKIMLQTQFDDPSRAEQRLLGLATLVAQETSDLQ